MRKLVVQAFLSIDGVMQSAGMPDEDRAGGFEYGGWLVPHMDDQMMGAIVEHQARAGGLLLGRKTYATMAEYWPHATDEDNPVASTMNNVPKYVASRTLTSLTWKNSTLLTGDTAEAVAEIKRAPGGEIQVLGSGELVQTLMKHDLVDEYRLWFFPLLLGHGKRLFADGIIPSGLRLINSRTSSTGVLMCDYERVGELKVGSFALD